MDDVPRVIAATDGRRHDQSRRVALRLQALRGGPVWTAVEVYEGVRCLGTRVLYEGTDGMAATIAGRVFNETVRALTADGVTGLEEIPAAYGYEIAEAATLVQRSGQQPRLDADFQLGDEDIEVFGLAITRDTPRGEDVHS